MSLQYDPRDRFMSVEGIVKVYPSSEKSDYDIDESPETACGCVTLFFDFLRSLVEGACSSCVLTLKQLLPFTGNAKSRYHARREFDINAEYPPFANRPTCEVLEHESPDYGTVLARYFRFEDESRAEQLLKHKALSLKNVRNAHLLPYLSTSELYEGTLCVVSRFAQGGDLKDHLRTFPECNRRALLSQVARGLEYLHRSGVTHGNLYTGNVVLSEDQTVKLSNFGLAELMPYQGLTQKSPALQRELVMHRAPEFYMGPMPEGDVYSFGMLAFYMFSDKEPMIDQYPRVLDVTRALRSGHRPDRSEITRFDFSNDLWATVQCCWAHDGEKRPTARRVLLDLEDAQSARAQALYRSYRDEDTKWGSMVFSRMDSHPSVSAAETRSVADDTDDGATQQCGTSLQASSSSSVNG